MRHVPPQADVRFSNSDSVGAICGSIGAISRKSRSAPETQILNGSRGVE